MVDIKCPACAYSYPTDEDNHPEDGNVFTCAHCGHIAIWEDDGWRNPSREEHAALIGDHNFLELLAIGMEFRDHVERDRNRMAALIVKHLDLWVTSGPGTTALAKAIADDVVKHGFHTHQKEHDHGHVS